MKRFALGALLGALLVSGIAYVVRAQARADWQAELDAANEQARHYALQYREVSQSWHDLAIQTTEQDSLLTSLRQTNERLANRLEQEQARVLSVTRTNTRLQAKLDSSASTVREDTAADRETFVVDVDERVAFNGGGFAQVRGSIEIETVTPTVDTDLSVEAGVPLTLVLSRTEDGRVQVDASTGDPRLQVTRLDVVRQATPPPAPRFSFAGALSNQLFSVGPWVNRGIGLAVGIFLAK